MHRSEREAPIVIPDTGIGFDTGWYGKLPARGDFLSRRLPGAFVHRWDAWLQSAILWGIERLGARWLDCYYGAPVWRFLISPGLVTGGALAGVLMPSADRIGRLFPLTIASVLAPGSVDPAKTLAGADAWFASIEAAARAALDPALDLDAYDERIKAIVFPAGNIVPLQAGGERGRMNPAESTGMPAIHARVRLGQNELEEAPIARLQSHFGGAPCALWLTRSSKVFGEWALATAGLPREEQFCAMLDGDWQGHGWS